MASKGSQNLRRQWPLRTFTNGESQGDQPTAEWQKRSSKISSMIRYDVVEKVEPGIYEVLGSFNDLKDAWKFRLTIPRIPIEIQPSVSTKLMEKK